MELTVGNKLGNATRDNLDERSNWWSLRKQEGESVTVFLNSGPNDKQVKLNLDAIPIARFDDWAVEFPEPYEDALLVSKNARIRNPLHLLAADDDIPLFESGFHYPTDGSHPPSLPPSGNFKETASSGASPSSVAFALGLGSPAGKVGLRKLASPRS